MNDLEISKALALAIGWPADCVAPSCHVNTHTDEHGFSVWRVFDYRDWNVIGPIAAKYNCFPTLMSYGLWDASVAFGTIYGEDTPQKAIALAVIQGAKT